MDAQCDIPYFARVGSITPERLFTPSDDAIGCFVSPDGGAAVLTADDALHSVAIVEGTRLLDNEHLADAGNAALGLALIGQHDHIVWYVPSAADSDLVAEGEGTLGTLTPDWVTPVILLPARRRDSRSRSVPNP